MKKLFGLMLVCSAAMFAVGCAGGDQDAPETEATMTPENTEALGAYGAAAHKAESETPGH